MKLYYVIDEFELDRQEYNVLWNDLYTAMKSETGLVFECIRVNKNMGHAIRGPTGVQGLAGFSGTQGPLSSSGEEHAAFRSFISTAAVERYGPPCPTSSLVDGGPKWKQALTKIKSFSQSDLKIPEFFMLTDETASSAATTGFFYIPTWFPRGIDSQEEATKYLSIKASPLGFNFWTGPGHPVYLAK